MNQPRWTHCALAQEIEGELTRYLGNSLLVQRSLPQSQLQHHTGFADEMLIDQQSIILMQIFSTWDTSASVEIELHPNISRPLPSMRTAAFKV